MKALQFTFLAALCAGCAGNRTRELPVDPLAGARSPAKAETAEAHGPRTPRLHSGIGWQLLTMRIGADGRLRIAPNHEYDERGFDRDYPQAVALLGFSF